MNKKEFLDTLRKELNDDNSDVINYYDELISDRIENGEKEKQVIKSLGNINNIINVLKIENKVSKQTKKNVVSNTVILMWVLLLMSSPMLLPLIIVIFALIFTFFMVIISLLITFGSLIFTFTIAPFAAIASVINGSMTIPMFILLLGISLFMIGISLLLGKLCIMLVYKFSSFVMIKTKEIITKFKNKREVSKNE